MNREVKPHGEHVISKTILNRQLRFILERKTYNRGLNMDHEFEFKSVKFRSESVKVHDRGPFLKEAQTAKALDYSIMDIVNLRQADMAVDSRGNRAADLMLNELSHEVIKYIEEYNQNKNKYVSFCRYGGDEFAFLYLGLSDEEIREFQTDVKAKIETIKGFFKTGNDSNTGIEKRNIEVRFKNIKKPIDQFGQLVFDYFMEDGVLLDEKEVEKIKTRFADIDSFRKWRELARHEFKYPANCVNFDQKIKYLASIDPNLESNLESLLTNAAGLNDDQRKEILSKLEAVFIDPLLKVPILSAADLIENIKSGNVSEVWTKDLKFLKQLNKISYADGDNAIRILWDNIRSTISDEDYSKLIFTRNGGTFMVGLKAGMKLDHDTIVALSRLDRIDFIDVTSKSKPITIGIGTHYHKVNEKLLLKQYGRRTDRLSAEENLELIGLMREESKQLFYMSDKLFYMHLAKYLAEPGNWSKVFNNHDREESFSYDSLLGDYFLSKRAAQHLIALDLELDGLNDSRYRNPYVESIRAKVRAGMNFSSKRDMNLDINIEILRIILTQKNLTS